MKAAKSTVFRANLAGLVLVCGTLFAGPVAAAQANDPKLVIDRIGARGQPTAADTALLKDVVVRRKLEQKEAELHSVFPETSAGRAVADIALLVPYGLRPTDQIECLLMAKRLGLVRENSADTLSAIQSGMAKLPSRYVAERQFLIQLAGRLPVAASQLEVLKKFLATEIQKPAVLESDGRAGRSFFNGAIALDALIELTNDPGQIESILVPALKVKTSQSERELLLSRYHAVFPDLADRLFPAFGVSPPSR
jgi:hypothetical protein